MAGRAPAEHAADPAPPGQQPSPEALLAGLRGTAPLPGGQDAEEGRTTSLAASISYSFAHLAEATRRLLPAVCLFHGVADADVLGIFSAGSGGAGTVRRASTAGLGRSPG